MRPIFDIKDDTTNFIYLRGQLLPTKVLALCIKQEWKHTHTHTHTQVCIPNNKYEKITLKLLLPVVSYVPDKDSVDADVNISRFQMRLHVELINMVK